MRGGWSHCTAKELYIPKKSPMTAVKLLADHLNIRSICIYDNPA
ncbi:hypothetical protein SLEP1_g1010 [Rubroshorea leprosula]|uniref:Uncharacterized protein n=1 Tax=Rubroshorea leprosula TaxID=152421 RepID=A0AAV5HKR4_9ROSI|nr:hypothetical protein SLEP1_g1010 [Rubroshorea leprosula]